MNLKQIINICDFAQTKVVIFGKKAATTDFKHLLFLVFNYLNVI